MVDAKSRYGAGGRARGVFVVVVALLLVLAQPSIGGAAGEEVRPIVLPIDAASVDVVSWSDTFGAPRSGGRSHEGVDMLGPRMVPLIAAADGVVSWLRHDTVRGNNLDITDADGWSYHYIHINNDTPGTDDGANPYEFAFAPGIERGATVRAGQVIAYLGDSGNAESVAPQLHFEIRRPDGTAINPTPSVDAALAAAADLSVVDLGPYGSGEELMSDALSTLRGSSAVIDERDEFAAAINEEGLVAAIETLVGPDSRAASVDRLYVAFFRRPPDYEGFRYWIERQGDGLGLVETAELFAASREYEERYGDLSFEEFLDLLYMDVLGRAPDQSGKAYWLQRLEDSNDIVTRGSIVAFFAESEELRGLTAERSEIVALTVLLEDRRPTRAEIDEWSAQRSDQSFADLARRWFDLP